MGSRSFLPTHLSGHFDISPELINSYFEDNSKHRPLTNYDSKTNKIIRSYIFGYEAFILALNDIHENITQKINLIATTENEETIKKFLFSSKKTNRWNNLLLESAKISLNRTYESLTQKNKIQIYDTQDFEGEIHFYLKIHNHAEYFLYELNSGKNQVDFSRVNEKSAFHDIAPLIVKQKVFSYYYTSPVIESTILLIRQAIELYIYQSLGILEFYSEKEKQIVSINWILKFIKKAVLLEKIVIPMEISLLIEINAWCNEYVHTGKMSAPNWLIEWAIYCIKPLFFGGYCDFQYSYNDRSMYADKYFYQNELFLQLADHLVNEINNSKGKNKQDIHTLEIVRCP